MQTENEVCVRLKGVKSRWFKIEVRKCCLYGYLILHRWSDENINRRGNSSGC